MRLAELMRRSALGDYNATVAARDLALKHIGTNIVSAVNTQVAHHKEHYILMAEAALRCARVHELRIIELSKGDA